MTSDMAVLLSRSCTTGWGDWVHGDLWLHSKGLIRCRLGLAVTVSHYRKGRTVGEPLPGIGVAGFDTATILGRHGTNKVIRFDAVRSANLRRGLSAHRLGVVMADGTSHKLLWLPGEPAYAVLSRALPELLGDRFARG